MLMRCVVSLGSGGSGESFGRWKSRARQGYSYSGNWRKARLKD